MRHARSLLTFTPICLSICLLSASSSFAADQHVVSPQQLAATVSAQTAQQDADRAAIHDALGRSDVREAAQSFGIDIDRANVAVDTLSGPDLTKAADAARHVNQQLVGGASTVVISTTTIIIILLLVILIVVLVKA